MNGVFQARTGSDEGEACAGPGDGRVEQFAAKHRAVFRREDEYGVGELGALRLVDGHGPGAFTVIETAGQDGAGRAVAVGKIDAHTPIRVGQGDANIAIAETEAGVVAGDEGGATDIPKTVALQDALALQMVFNGAVDAGDAPRALAQGAEDAEIGIVLEDGLDPRAMLLRVFWRRLPRRLPDAAIGGLGAGEIQYLVDGGGGLPGESAGLRALQDADGGFGVTAVDGIRQSADFGIEAVTALQADDA